MPLGGVLPTNLLSQLRILSFFFFFFFLPGCAAPAPALPNEAVDNYLLPPPEPALHRSTQDMKRSQEAQLATGRQYRTC